MKKFIIIIASVFILILLGDTLYYRYGFYIDLNPDKEISSFVKTDGERILLDDGNGYKVFEIKGVNMGSGMPGEWSTDFKIDKETYLRWFKQIKEMGANTLRIYTVQNDTFYNAFYEFNENNDDPLYLIHGVWVNDYIQNSHRDAYDEEFKDKFLSDCMTMIDVVHGQKKISLGTMASAGSGTYNKDISKWVIGYILGVEWEDLTVAYTDHKYADDNLSYEGKYMYSSSDASAFEVMLTEIGDRTIQYESDKYKTQKLVAFSNWPTTDPFNYPENVASFFMKCARVDVEHIKTTDEFISGQFASYHIYPYYPDCFNYIDNYSDYGISDVSSFLTEDGKINTYKAYLQAINNHHTMPVVISEFGVSTGRGMAQKDQNTNRNQGNTSETEQGYSLISCYEDIMSAGSSGAIVFTWQDEWFKRTWNTMYAVNLRRTPYWSDFQTNEQYFGLLSFDPGEDKCVSYNDGDISEWTRNDVVCDYGDSSISYKYDERYIYLMVYKKDFDFDNDVLYIPIDTTYKSGSSYDEANDIKFDRAADFLITINGKDSSRIQVQERYESLRSTYSQNVYGFDSYLEGNIPDIDSPKFVNIDMILQTATALLYNDNEALAEVFETGKLRYGNGNPESSDFDSISDFMVNGDYIEIRLPWQLLNFSDPSRMTVHDDYYENYGVDFIQIDKMYIGLGDKNSSGRIHMEPCELKGWGNKVTYHERLKKSYYMLQKVWRDNS